MKKIALALAATSLASAPAFAGTYINAEINDGYTGSEYLGRTVDLHIGFEGSKDKFSYYVQGGPQLTAVADVDGSETELSGKVGGNFQWKEKIGFYGEISTATNGDEDRNYGTKIGAKYNF